MQILNPITGQELKLHHLDQTPSLYFKLRTIEGIFAHYLQSLQYSHQAVNTIEMLKRLAFIRIQDRRGSVIAHRVQQQHNI